MKDSTGSDYRCFVVRGRSPGVREFQGKRKDKKTIAIPDYEALRFIVGVASLTIPAVRFEKTIDKRIERRARVFKLKALPMRLGPKHPTERMEVDVIVFQDGATVRIEFNRMVSWILPDETSASGMATVWSADTICQSDEPSILEAIDSKMDEFLALYLEANR